jgi:hypothetical protein
MEGLSYVGCLNGVSLMEFTNQISDGVVMSFIFIWKSVAESLPYLFHILTTILKHILLKNTLCFNYKIADVVTTHTY